MPRVEINRIVFDPLVYPRKNINQARVSRYAEAMRSGAIFPRPKLGRNMKLATGVMTIEAAKLNGYSEIDVDYINNDSDVELFRQALMSNSAHGTPFTGYDHAWIVLRGEAMGLTDDQIAALIHITPGFLRQATDGWFARDQKGRRVPLKRTIRHLKGKKLNADQLDANDKLSGMEPTFYANQLILLLENDLQDDTNAKFKERLTYLVGLASNYLNRSNRKMGVGR